MIVNLTSENPPSKRPTLLRLAIFTVAFLVAMAGMDAWLYLTQPSLDQPSDLAMSLTDSVKLQRDLIGVAVPTPQPEPTLPAVPGAAGPAKTNAIPVYDSADLMSDYFSNVTYPIIFEGKPWDSGSVDVLALQEPGGGTTYWDYWSVLQDWETPNHQWQDDDGNWHTYHKETIKDARGQATTAYVLVDRKGPGVMDKLWFTNDAVTAISGITNPTNPQELVEWGNLSKLGYLRIEVDERVVFDGPIQSWFSGAGQTLPSALGDILVWHYRQLGANGNIIPIPYSSHLKVLVYGGEKKPKWFMATGMTLPAGSRVKPYSPDALPLKQMIEYARNVARPEEYINSLPSYPYILNPQVDAPSVLSFEGAGTIRAFQFRVPKSVDLKALVLTIRNGQTASVSLPFLGFFTQPAQPILHRSTPIGVVDAGDSYLFYSNLPMPYHDGLRLELGTTSRDSVGIRLQLSQSQDVYSTELRVVYTPLTKLGLYEPDYRVHLDGDGKLVGLVLDTQDQRYEQVPHIRTKDPNKDDIDKIVWPMGYLEGNLTIKDGLGNSRYYSGHEDWAEGGYYFNLGFTTPPGGSNRPFAGVLRYKGGNDGYATLFRYFSDLSAFRFKGGVDLSFGHGTYRNNFPVSYSVVVFYYVEIPGTAPVTLPASEYVTQPATANIKP